MQPCERTSNCSQKRVRPSSPPRLPVHSVQLNRAPTSHAESPSLPPSDLHWRSVAHELFKSLPTAFSEHPSVMQNIAKGEALAPASRGVFSARQRVSSCIIDVLQFAVYISETCAQLQLKLDAVTGDCIQPLAISHLTLTLRCSSGRASTQLSQARA